MDDEIKQYDVSVSKAAAKQLEKIYLYIKDDLLSEQAAVDLIDDLEHAITSLEMMPYRGFEYKRGSHKKYRQILVKNFTIVYKIMEDNNKVKIMAVKYAPSNYGGE